MASFPGGSAFAMARDIGGGYVLVTERTYQRFSVEELDQLAFELDRSLRETRGDQPPLEDLAAIQLRNRKLQRLTGALTMLRGYQQRVRSRSPRPADGKPGDPRSGSR